MLNAQSSKNMKSFLESVAEDLLKRYGTDLSRVAVVFPNKRASLFLNEHLARLAGHPIWSPAYITISDLFRSHSPLKVADPILLVCELHKCFIQCTGINESLDHFYGWGQLLLADFDDLDKNMAPADKVFANLRDIHELDDVSYLTDEQREMIRRFFSNFTDDHNSELKERFLRLWSHIGDIYHTYNAQLAAQQLCYEGALYRQVATDETLQFDHDAYVFIGFNLLQQVEQVLFRRLEQAGKAVFYQDTDEVAPEQVTYISAPTENIQARYIPQWLTPERIAAGRRTAIVLCNEGLLQAVIHCLPENVNKVNITTGYPLLQTPVASLVAGSTACPAISMHRCCLGITLPTISPTTLPSSTGSSTSSATSPRLPPLSFRLPPLSFRLPPLSFRAPHCHLERSREISSPFPSFRPRNLLSIRNPSTVSTPC